MSATCTHKTFTNQTETTYIITLTGNTGSVTELLGTGDIFVLEYENIEPTKLHANPVQSARLEFNMLVRDANDQQVLTNIFNADEGAYTLSITQDGQTLFSGSVLNDMLEFSEGDYPNEAKIVAKDFTRLKGFTLDHTTIPTAVGSTRASISTVIEQILDPILDGRDINYFVTWGHSEITGDFVDGIFLDTTALQDFNKREDPNDNTDFTNYDLLESICKNFGLIIRQALGEFQVYQYSAISQLPTISVDGNERYILPSSNNVFNPGVKRAKYTYDHRTIDSTITLPDVVDAPEGSLNQSTDFSQAFVSSGEQEIQIDARSTRLDFTSVSDSDYRELDLFARIQIEIQGVGQSFYWNNDAGEWTNEPTINLFNATKSRINKVAIATIAIRAGDIPASADGTLTVRFFNGVSIKQGEAKLTANIQFFADATTYGSTGFEIFNEQSTGNTSAIAFAMTQDGTFSEEVDHGTVLFGEGPVLESPGSLTYSNDVADLTDGNWIDPNGNTVTFAELLLKEIIGVQSRGTRNLQAQLYGVYNGHSALLYDSTTFFFIGGSLTGNNVFTANFVEIEYITATISVFDQIEEDSSGGLGGTVSTDDLVTFREAVKANQFFNTIFLSNFIGELSSPISAGSTITSFTANLSAQIRVGEDFVLVDKANERPFFVSVVADPDTGAEEYNTGENRVVHVEEQFIKNDLPVGSPVILSGGLLESYFTIDPTKLSISVDSMTDATALGRVDHTSRVAGATFDFIKLSNSLVSADNPVQVKDDEQLVLRSRGGQVQTLVARGDQTYTSSPFQLQVDSFTHAFDVGTASYTTGGVVEVLNVGSSVARIDIKADENEASITSLTSITTNNGLTSSTNITQRANQTDATVVLKTDFNGNVGAFEMNSNADGSTISINADQITVAGQTTFLSALEGELDIPEDAVVIVSATEPSTRDDGSPLQAGDVWKNTSENDLLYTYDGTDWIRSFTQIDGGDIVTGTVTANKIDVDDLFAQNITITSGGSIEGGSTASGFISGSDGFQINADGSAEFNDIALRTGGYSFKDSGIEIDGDDLNVNGTLTVGNPDNTSPIGKIDLTNTTLGTASTNAGGSGDDSSIELLPISFQPRINLRSTTSHFINFLYADNLDASGNERGASLGFIGIGTSGTMSLSGSNGMSVTFDVNGDIECTTLTETSDKYQKENIEPLGSTLDKIVQLEGKTFDMLGPSTEKKMGLLAQDVEPLFPEAVGEGGGFNEEGERIEYKTLSYTQLIPALIESIKELKQEIDQLKNEQGI